MTEALAAKTCTPCRGGVAPLTREGAAAYLAGAPGWRLSDNANLIDRRFGFSNFRDAYDFVRKISELAEGEGHHPDIAFGWGYASVSLQTKKIKGLHENDFIMAAKINQLAAPAAG